MLTSINLSGRDTHGRMTVMRTGLYKQNDIRIWRYTSYCTILMFWLWW